MRVMLGSGGFRTDERISSLSEQMHSFFADVDQLLFVPYALHDHDAYVQTILDRRLNAGYELDSIHRHADPVNAVRNSSAIYVGGGNTFRLLSHLYQLGLVDAIRARVKAGIPYLGISAGANIACPTIKTTNDMPITQPPTFDALGLVPFQLNPHYYTGRFYLPAGATYQEHFGETRDERIREFHEMNDIPVVALWEAGILRCEQGQIRLIGTPARIFRKGLEPVDLPPGATLEQFLADV
jgi:dipeptidase E